MFVISQFLLSVFDIHCYNTHAVISCQYSRHQVSKTFFSSTEVVFDTSGLLTLEIGPVNHLRADTIHEIDAKMKTAKTMTTA